MRPILAAVVRELQAADPSNAQGPMKRNASPGDQSEAPGRRWKPGQVFGPDIWDPFLSPKFSKSPPPEKVYVGHRFAFFSTGKAHKLLLGSQNEGA